MESPICKRLSKFLSRVFAFLIERYREYESEEGIVTAQFDP